MLRKRGVALARDNAVLRGRGRFPPTNGIRVAVRYSTKHLGSPGVLELFFFCRLGQRLSGLTVQVSAVPVWRPERAKSWDDTGALEDRANLLLVQEGALPGNDARYALASRWLSLALHSGTRPSLSSPSIPTGISGHQADSCMNSVQVRCSRCASPNEQAFRDSCRALGLARWLRLSPTGVIRGRCRWLGGAADA